MRKAVALAALAGMIGAPVSTSLAQSGADAAAGPGPASATTTPIEHVIIIIGENRTFDHVFATYKPKRKGETIDNLLSKHIVKIDGSPGSQFHKARQFFAEVTHGFSMAPAAKHPYKKLPPAMTGGAPEKSSDTSPPPFATVKEVAMVESVIRDGLDPGSYKILTTGATGLPSYTVDKRIPNALSLPSGPFQITGKKLPADSYTSSPVHRFYQMWQQLDCSAAHATAENPSGCLADLFPWVEVTIGAGTNGQKQPKPFTNQTTGEGSTAMGFFNMAKGDAPYFKELADTYTSSDNFHQSIQGGTGANHIALGTGLGMYFSDGHGHIKKPPANDIENPNPQKGTNNWYVQDGYSGGSYSNCSDPNQPGVKEVEAYLASLPSHPSPNCAPGAYYLLNNYNPGYYGNGKVNTSPFTIPPSSVPTIANTLNAHGVSWRYYGAGWDNYVKDPNSPLGYLYCNICNPFLYSTSVMTSAKQRTEHLKDIPDLDADLKSGKLPAVSFVKPDALLDGHPASSKIDLLEAFVRHVVDGVKADKKLWAHTAILVTMDEGGGYWDSGYVQPLDFFGDGTRIVAIMVSPYSTGGHVSHVYGDHVSFLKFIEKNWSLPPVSAVGRDNLPNPITTPANLYAPTNSPAIGDLTDMFHF